MSSRPKRTATLVKPSAEVQADRDVFEQKIKELFAFMPEILITASITSLETLEDPWKQDCITFYAGRRSDYLAKAAERHPTFFKSTATPKLEDLLALFALAQMSREKDWKIYSWWQDNYKTVTGWGIIDRINELKGRRKRVSPNAIVIKQAKVKFADDSITVKPVGQRIVGQSNGSYKVELERSKKGNKDGSS